MSSVSKDPRKERIRKYVGKYPNKTKAQVIRYMKGRSATITTHKIIQEYIDDGIFRMLKDKKNSQVHHLFINDSNEFNLIDRQLSEFSNTIEAMEKPIHTGNVVLDYLGYDYSPEYKKLFNLKGLFELTYAQIFTVMLEVLLVRIREKNPSEENSQILYWKVIKLMQRVILQFYKVSVESSLLDSGISNLERVIREFDSNTSEVKSSVIDISLINEILTETTDFKKQFLPDR